MPNKQGKKGAQRVASSNHTTAACIRLGGVERWLYCLFGMQTAQN